MLDLSFVLSLYLQKAQYVEECLSILDHFFLMVNLFYHFTSVVK